MFKSNGQLDQQAAETAFTPGAIGARGSAAEIAVRSLNGFDRLLRAYEYAQDLDCDVWDLALEIAELRAADLSNSDLRWLLRKGFADHAREVSLPGEETRVFHASQGLAFTKRTCFVLTKAGAIFLRQLRAKNGVERSLKLHAAIPTPHVSGRTVAVPHWNRDLQELRVDGILVKQFKVPAPNQEIVLAAFEEEGWPQRIDDPLPPHSQQDPKRRLHDTINSLNRSQKAELIRFQGDGTGQGVRWEAKAAEETDD